MKTHISLRYDSAEYGWWTRCGRLVQDLDMITSHRGPFIPMQDLCQSCKKSADEVLAFTIESATEALEELREHEAAHAALFREGQRVSAPHGPTAPAVGTDVRVTLEWFEPSND